MTDWSLPLHSDIENHPPARLPSRHPNHVPWCSSGRVASSWWMVCRMAGCKCDQPLFGWWSFLQPSCTVVSLIVVPQKRFPLYISLMRSQISKEMHQTKDLNLVHTGIIVLAQPTVDVMFSTIADRQSDSLFTHHVWARYNKYGSV